MNRKQRRGQRKTSRKPRSADNGAGISPISKSSSEAILNKAVALQKKGFPDEALGLYRQFLAGHPNHPEGLMLAGTAALQSGQAEEATNLLQAAESVRPGDPDTCNNLGLALSNLERFEDAVTAFRRALAMRPNHAITLNNLGVALRRSGDVGEALAVFRQAIEIKPDFAGAYGNLGKALRASGKLDAAAAAHRRSLEIRPGHAETYRSLTTIKTFVSEDDDMVAMRGLLASPSLGDSEAMNLCFGLGKAYQDIGDFERAFYYYARANRLKRATLRYDITADEDLAERIASVFDSPLITRQGGNGCPSEAPVFVLGMPRSGTTLVEQILVSHSKVHGAGELEALGRLVRGPGALSEGGGGFPETAAELDPDEPLRLGQSYVEALRRRAPNAARITDKMPVNFLYIGMIRLILPNARIIHCVRDPVDTCLSCYQTLFSGNQDFSYDLGELGRYYRLYARLMDHWRGLLPGRIHEVRYEDVVADQRRQSERLLAFCGLEWEDGCLSFHNTERPIQTASASQVRQPIYTRSVQRWKPYRRHLGPLLEALGPVAENHR